jgi:peptidase C13-like protein
VSAGRPPRRLRWLVAGAVLLLIPAAPAASASPLADWTAVVVAGDWRAGEGKTTKAFDNGRRDVAKALVEAGFTPDNVLQYSLRPRWPGDDSKVVSDAKTAVTGFMAKAETARSGCLFYITSHGLRDGAIFGPDLAMTPDMLRRLMAEACPARPSVVVVSACFSGVFIKPLAAPDRMVLTAARKDRTSFGCGADDIHTYFDDCLIRVMPKIAGFLDLPVAVKACVAARETATRMSPPSQPQVSIGRGFAALADTLAFAKP